MNTPKSLEDFLNTYIFFNKKCTYIKNNKESHVSNTSSIYINSVYIDTTNCQIYNSSDFLKFLDNNFIEIQKKHKINIVTNNLYYKSIIKQEIGYKYTHLVNTPINLLKEEIVLNTRQELKDKYKNSLLLILCSIDPNIELISYLINNLSDEKKIFFSITKNENNCGFLNYSSLESHVENIISLNKHNKKQIKRLKIYKNIKNKINLIRF